MMMSDDEPEYISIFQPEPPLTLAERRGRAVLLCSSFLRNLAFSRAGLEGKVQTILLRPDHPQFEFWREAHVNFLDICILEWCKLFADRKGEHHWRRLIDDPVHFEADLYAKLKITADVFRKVIKDANHYRNKFVAHLDEERRMLPPKLDLPKNSVVFLYGHLDHDATESVLDREFARCIEKAKTIYEDALDRRRPN